MQKQFGRSMVEMLGVLAIIGVLSIGGIALYRRAVNNHHANTILDDVNRFAFVITEHGGYPEGEDIPKGDFKESGIYQLKGHQAYSGQYSITALNVPKGICEILIDKGIVDYKVGVVTAGHDVTEEILYDTLNTNICTHDLNDIAFYFGDVSAVCNDPDESGYTPCTENSDCCGEYFCAFENPNGCAETQKGNGTCLPINIFGGESVSATANGVTTTWLRNTKTYNGKFPTWWSTQNWCTAMGKVPASRIDIGCKGIAGSTCSSPILDSIPWNNDAWYWLEDFQNACGARVVNFSDNYVGYNQRYGHHRALCH